jgi:drug/metabolite transporter (DMT)-like permease
MQAVAVDRRRRRGLLVAGAALYAWVAGHFIPFTWPAAVVTFVPGAVALALSTRLPRRATPRRGLHRHVWIAWALGITAFVALETFAFFAGSSTEGHPTVSNIVNHGLHWNETRALAFFGWLALGDWLLRR